MSSDEIMKGKDLEANLVIIGGGGAGLAAAVTAAENGTTNIIVLEKAGSVGGNTAMGGGIFAAESPAQSRAAIDASRDDIFKKAMDYAHWKSNPRIVRAFIDKSGDTIRWLEAKGLYFECHPLYYGQSPVTWHQPRGRAAEIIKILAEEGKKLGVPLLTHTQAKKLQTGPKGNISGVLAETKGKEFTITAKSVIIATGGYGANKALIKKYFPYYHDNMRYNGVPANTGDGLVMAMEIGAATQSLGLLLIGDGPNSPDALSIKFSSLPDKQRVAIAAVIGDANTIWVNNKGERFSDETAASKHLGGGAIARQPDHAGYCLFDHNIVQIKTERGVLIGHGPYRKEQRTEMPGLEREIRTLADKGSVKIADSWDEIAKWIGADPKALKATIDEYNVACNQGRDPIFAKDRKYLIPFRTPPYYAIRGSSGYLDTLGGIKINEHMEALDQQDNPIPGLFAAGVTAGGWQAESYCGVYMSGAAAGFAVNSGRIAGETAARFVSASQ